MNVKELIEELQNMMVGVWLGYYDSHGKFIETRESISLSEHYDEKNEEWFYLDWLKWEKDVYLN